MNSIMEKFTGIHVALHACYDKHDEVHAEAYRRLCAYYQSKGVKGLYICGSTGEGLLLNIEERKKILEIVMEAVQGRMTVTVQVGAVATKDSIALAKHAQSMQVDAVSSLPCIYYTANDRAIERHWRAIIDSTDLPFIIYNIPETTHYNLTEKLCTTMAAYDKVIGIKNSSMSAYDINRFKRIGGEDFIVFNGPDEQYLAGRVSGAQAGIGGSYGVMPEFFLKIEEYIQNDDIRNAQRVQDSINYVIEGMYATGTFVGAAKKIICERIADIGQPRMPILPLPEHMVEHTVKLARYIDRSIDSL